MSSEADPDPRLGKVIDGDLRLTEVLGEGAMGRVYAGRRAGRGEWIAVKLLHGHRLSDETSLRRFRREAEAAMRLSHPALVRTLGYGTLEDGTPFIEMELFDADDLLSILEDSFPLPEARILAILDAVLGAVEEAHRRGVIHRDLKPENILVEELEGGEDRVKVCDFGLVKLLGRGVSVLTREGHVCGTPEYMAPEQVCGDPLSVATDIYAVGAVLYHCLTGRPPLRGKTVYETLEMHLKVRPTPPAEVYPEGARSPVWRALAALALRALEKGPQHRPRSAAAMREALRACAEARDEEAGDQEAGDEEAGEQEAQEPAPAPNFFRRLFEKIR